MKLVELVKYFRKGDSFEQFCVNQALDIGAEVIEIYMKKPFSIDNDLAFFEIEKTEGKIEYIFSDISYYNLFDFYYFLDAIEESINASNLPLNDDVIAKRLYDYAINNA